jgi:hypothetical protein
MEAAVGFPVHRSLKGPRRFAHFDARNRRHKNDID